ncbi:TetR/AcrR family transcriptional regulator [Isoptericola sp. NPDC057191]|uniref:TetR/AcrR family transcriptional regulator n=1 Tax=Isoptericola sp. NPDC057191 TaxID=3346041 RepID=UPI003640F353
MAALRADAARSRARILEAARGVPPGTIRLNDLARDTGLGVGTVYRHFPTVASLLEALHLDALEELAETARRVAESPSPGASFLDLVRHDAELLLTRDGLRELLIAADVSDEVRALREQFLRSAGVALEAAVREHRVRAEISVEQIQRLVCGVEYAVRLGDGRDRVLLLDVMISGLRA